MTEAARWLEIRATALRGVSVVTRTRREDARGFFSRFFCADELAATGFAQPIAQVNHTLTRHRGTVRGLHFQHPRTLKTSSLAACAGKCSTLPSTCGAARPLSCIGTVRCFRPPTAGV